MSAKLDSTRALFSHLLPPPPNKKKGNQSDSIQLNPPLSPNLTVASRHHTLSQRKLVPSCHWLAHIHHTGSKANSSNQR